MPFLPEGQSLLIRTYFGDQRSWERTVVDAQAVYSQPDGSTPEAILTIVDDPAFADLTVEGITEILDGPLPGYLFIADVQACTEPEEPILVVDLSSGSGGPFPSFRVIPKCLALVENNLSIANLSFAELSAAADQDGVYRGAESEEPQQQLRIRHQQLIDAADSMSNTPVIERLRADLANHNVPVWTAVRVEDLRRSRDQIAAQSYRTDMTVGYAEMLEALAEGGAALGIHLSLPDSYWTLYIDPDDYRIRAAMKVYYPS